MIKGISERLFRIRDGVTKAFVVDDICQAYDSRKNELSHQKASFTKQKVKLNNQRDTIVKKISDKEVELAECKEEIKRLNDQ